MKKNYFFSIIIPTFNREFKLERAIQSVFNQTYQNWEMIIVDNYSKDNTKKMVENFKSNKIKFYQINNNGVIAKSRNLGVKKSSGKYLAFLDSDDYWNKNKLTVCRNEIIKFKNLKLIYHNMYLKKKDNQIFFQKTNYFRKVKKKVRNDLINNGPAYPTSGVIVDKKLFIKINMFREMKKFIAWEDFDAWIRLSKYSNDFHCIQNTLGYLSTDIENTNNTKIQIKNLKCFKNEYIKGDKKIPNWCIYALMRCYQKNRQFKESLRYLKKLNISGYSLIQKFKLLIFYFLNIFKITI
jgi:glycosyltransferase involved in cell wall biosynthesis